MGSPLESRSYSRADCAVFRKTAEAFGGLSNMAPGFPVQVNGVRILTVEALYQACRFPHRPEVQRKIIEQTSPMTAKMVGKPYRGDSRPDWDRVRVKIMRWVLRLKLATHWTQFSALLLSTGQRPIVEDSRKDDFWGAMPTDAATLVGMNVLGRLLMELREEIKQGAGLRRVEPPSIPEFLLFDEVMGVIDFRNDKSKPYAVEVASPSPAVHDFSMSLFPDPAPDTAGVPLIAGGREAAATAYQSLVANLKPYPDYKESGFPWLGRCPEHWSFRRTKTLFSERVQKGFPKEPLLAATQTKGVVRKEDYGTRTVTAQKDLYLLKLVEPGDYVISLRSFQGGIELAHYRGIISPAYTVLQPRAEANSGYYTHFFKSRQFIDSLSLFVTGIREGQNIDYERMSRAEMPLPPMDEQAAIVRVLAHANRKIDGFIRAKRKLIGLLNEQRQAIIHSAVTRGLQPDVPLKPSGIPWLGDIPMHWEARAFARMSRVVRGSSPRPAGDKRFFNGDFMPWVTVGEVTKDREMYLKSTGTFLTQMGAERSTIFPAGTLILTNSGATLGVPKILELNACANDGIVAFLSLRSLIQKPFAYLFLSTLTQRLRDEMRQGGTQPNLNTGIVRRIVCPVPPVADQEAIFSYVERESAPLNTAIARTEREIALMQEYRTRLTADIVTGKLDVREAAAQLPAPPTALAAEPVADEPLDDTETEEIEA